MAASTNFVQVTPFLGTGPIADAIAFYRDVLGFTVFVDDGGYAYLERDRIGLRLLELDAGASNPPGCSHIYVDVRDVTALFAEVQPRLASLPVARWGGLKDAAYGQREFWVRDPAGNLVTFGQGIAANAGQWNYRDAD